MRPRRPHDLAAVIAAGLLVVLLIAKILVLWGRPLPVSPWSALAFVWQDVAVALGFFAFARLVRYRALVLPAYAALVVLTAANVSVGRVLSTPLTAPLLRAARGTLADSLFYHATAANLMLTALVLAAGVTVPVVLHRRLRTRTARIDELLGATAGRRVGAGLVAAAAFAVVALGPVASARVDTGGLERNVLVALARSGLPRVRGIAAHADWRRSPLAAEPLRDNIIGPLRADAPPGSAAPDAVRTAGAGVEAGAAADLRHLDATAAAVDLRHLRGAAAGTNVLLVVLESTAARYLGVYGARADPMPNLTALAARAIVFDNAYAVYPESIKGLVPLLASRDPALDIAAEDHAPAMTPSLATALARAGYDTGLFHSGRFMYLGMQELLERSGFATLEDAGHIGGNHDSSFGVDETAAVRRVLEWIDARPPGHPFFAAYLPIAGHHPYAYTTPGPFASNDDLGRYLNALHEGDLALEELFDGLRTRGLDRSTIIVVIGDHGEAFGQHDGNYGHNLAIYDENVRVPLLIALPDGGDTDRATAAGAGNSAADPHGAAVGANSAADLDGALAASAGSSTAPVSPGARVGRVASLIDVAPTILDLLGLDPPSSFDGGSLLEPDRRMALFFTDYSLGLLGLRDGCLKFIHALESGRSRLFNLCEDPDERVDLAGDPAQAERLAAYRDHVRAWSAARIAERTDARDRDRR